MQKDFGHQMKENKHAIDLTNEIFQMVPSMIAGLDQVAQSLTVAADLDEYSDTPTPLVPTPTPSRLEEVDALEEAGEVSEREGEVTGDWLLAEGSSADFARPQGRTSWSLPPTTSPPAPA